DVHHMQFHHRGKANRRTAIVGENEKRCSIRNKATVESHPIEDRAHRVLTNPEAKVPCTVVVFFEVSGIQNVGKGRLVEIGRTPDKSRRLRRDCTLRPGGGFASCQRVFGSKGGYVSVPSFRKFTVQHALKLCGRTWIVSDPFSESPVPFPLQFISALDAAPKFGQRLIRHVEFGLERPSIKLLGQLDLFDSERLAMRLRCILAMRASVANVGSNPNQGGAMSLRTRALDGI